MSETLDLFLPFVRDWFRGRYGQPTAPQALGWPAIQRGEHTLIFSPTGSGKTLAAFLWGIDSIYRDLDTQPGATGVRLLYISPLKALNNDIERNLREPLAGIRRKAHQAGTDLPPVHVAVRTGDTPASARQRMVKHPPHILITTPESLYLLLTSLKASDMLASVKTVIVDEIHTLCGNKRGVHLGLSLERLCALVRAPLQRIGLSATQHPLDEVAHFLGGQDWVVDEQGQERLVSRPVTIVDAGSSKPLDLQVITPVADLRHMPGNSVWPSLIPQVLDQVRRHRTTLVFSNSRRGAERAADRLNEQYLREEAEDIPPGSPEGLLEDGVPKDGWMFGTGVQGGPFRAHHGSISKEARLELERSLKAGELPALIGTSSLELGIDIGSVDMVVQLQSPRSVARGLQRVGRSGHLVGQTSVGRIYATFREDILDAGAVAHGMLRGDIEPTYTPQLCLDVLAQQIVAMVATASWDVSSLHRHVRQAYGYQNLSRETLVSVLDMLSGRYPSEAFRELRPRIAWDRINDYLNPLPGTRLLAVNNGGTIPDRGLFRVYLPDRKTLLGTLDEEFIYETRRGDVFTLGSGTWRVLEIDEDKVVVGDAASSMPRMPFWRGDAPRREYHTGVRLGEFRRLLAQRVAELPSLPDDLAGNWPEETQPVIDWLRAEYAMDESSARNAIIYVRQQLDVMGAISSDNTVIVEVFSDAIGDQRMAVHSCFGGRVNSAWALVLSHALREQLGLDVETQANDDGILFRLVDADRPPPTDIVRAIGPDEARERLLVELPSSALFGAQFRMNAARALLLPSVQGAGRRTPFWLQRMRAKDLLAAAKNMTDFPLIAETYRDCLTDVLDLPHLMDVLGKVQAGEIRVVEAETLVPSPVSGSLLFDFVAIQMYEGDLPKGERQMQALALNRELLSQLLDEGVLPDLLRPEAVSDIETQLQHTAVGYQARSMEELALFMHDLGDLTSDEISARATGEGRAWLLQLAVQGRVLAVDVPCQVKQGDGDNPEEAPCGVLAARRPWVLAEDYGRYRDAFGLSHAPQGALPEALLREHRDPEAAREALLRLYARTHGPFTLEQLAERYSFPADWLSHTLDRLVATGVMVSGRLAPGATGRQWCDRRVLERIHRHTLSLLRRQVRPVSLMAYTDFLLRWQHAHASSHVQGEAGLLSVLQQLRGLGLPGLLWERDILPLRVRGYRPSQLDALFAKGDLVWLASGEDARRGQVRFFFRGEGSAFAPQREQASTKAAVGAAAQKVLAFLEREGASYADDLRRALRMPSAELDAALVELLLAGLVTNDSYDAMRLVLAGQVGSTGTHRQIESSLDAILDAWKSAREPHLARRPALRRLRQGRPEVEQRIAPPLRWAGRWALVHRISVWGDVISEQDRGLRYARQLLQRYGVVARECLAHEDVDLQWGAVYPHLELMELRGEVRRGYFVRGYSGAQFALPEAVERLRAWNEGEGAVSAELTILNAWDPANPYGSSTAATVAADGASWGEVADSEAETTQASAATENGALFPGVALSSTDAEEGFDLRFARLPGNYIVLQRGFPVLVYEHGSGRWTVSPHTAEGIIREAVQLTTRHLTREGGLCSRPRRVVVRLWNGGSPLGSAAQGLLESVGFRREPPAMVWDGP